MGTEGRRRDGPETPMQAAPVPTVPCSLHPPSPTPHAGPRTCRRPMTAWCVLHRLRREELSTWISTVCMGPAAHSGVTATCNPGRASLPMHSAPPQGQLHLPSRGPGGPCSQAWVSPSHINLYQKDQPAIESGSLGTWVQENPIPLESRPTAPTVWSRDSVPAPPWTAHAWTTPTSHTGHAGSPNSRVRVSDVKQGVGWGISWPSACSPRPPPGSSSRSTLKIKAWQTGRRPGRAGSFSTQRMQGLAPGARKFWEGLC